MDVVWDGIAQAELLNEEGQQLRNALADAAKGYNWPRVFEILRQQPEWVNACRPGSTPLYAPLHQAAHGGAPIEIAEQLIAIGAWRTLQNARGERPVDVAERTGHNNLLHLLEPEYGHRVPLGVLHKIQSYFHEVILGRIEREFQIKNIRLPELEPLLELDQPKMWFPVPGMYGGFSYWLDSCGVEAKLISESWCRVAGGSGQRHEITSAGSRLVEEGFV